LIGSRLCAESLVRFDDFLTVIVPTIGAHPVRQFGLVALRTHRTGRRFEFV